MPPSDRASFNPALLKPAAGDGAGRDQRHAAADEPSPWPWRVAVPLIAGLSMALWAGLAGIARVFGAG